MVLEAARHEVITAASGDEGLTRVRAERPDLVILDVIMKTVLDGLYVSEQLARDPQGPKPPVLMVTSIPGSEYAALFPTDEYIPVDQFVTKPIAPADLLRRVASLV